MSRARDVANFIPPGGDTGTILVKNSPEDYDFVWGRGLAGFPSITAHTLTPASGPLGTTYTSAVTADGDPAPAITRVWLLNGSVIIGETGATVTPSGTGTLVCRATATNDVGFTQADSNTVSVQAALTSPAITQNTITPSSAVAGDTLTSNVTATGNPAPAIARQWILDGVDIPGATGATHVTAEDGSYTCRVTATNSEGAVSTTSAAVAVSLAPVAPVITVNTVTPGSASVGDTLTSNVTVTGFPAPVVTRRWQANGVDVPGATASTLDPTTPADYVCLVTATNSAGAVTDAASNTVAVAAAPEAPAISVVTITPETAVSGDVLTLTYDVTGDPVPTVSVVWTRDAVEIPGETADTYTTVPADIGTDVRGVVTATNTGGTAEASSAAVAVTSDLFLTGGSINIGVTPPELTVVSSGTATAYWIVTANATEDAADVVAGTGTLAGNFAAGAGATPTDIDDITTLASGLWYAHVSAVDGGDPSNVISSAFQVPNVIPSTWGITLTPGVEEITAEETGTAPTLTLTAGVDSVTVTWTGGSVLDLYIEDQAFPGDITRVNDVTSPYVIDTGTGGVTLNVAVATDFETAMSESAPVVGEVTIVQSPVVISSTSNTPSYAGAITVGAGADRAVAMVVHGVNSVAEIAPLPGELVVTLGGVAMTEVVAPVRTADRKSWSALFVRAAPATGSNAVSVTWPGGDSRACAVVATEMTGVDQLAPIEASGSEQGPGGSTITSLAFTAPDGGLCLSGITLSSGNLGGSIAVTAPGTALQIGQTGILLSNDLSYGTAYANEGHGYTFPSERAQLVWARIRAAA